MLISFRVENHKPLRDEQTLSLVAAEESGLDDPRRISSPALGVKLLPAVALYGAMGRYGIATMPRAWVRARRKDRWPSTASRK